MHLPRRLQLRIDAVAASAAVPEPGTVLLFGMGLMGLLGYRRYTTRRPKQTGLMVLKLPIGPTLSKV